MKACPEDCDVSCYRCLRSFKNKFEHSLLDRHVGAELLEYVLNGEQPEFNTARLHTSTALLYNDLQRQGIGGVQFKADVPIPSSIGTVVAPILAEKTGGQQFIIALSGPLTTDHPADPKIREWRDSGSTIQVIVESELIVRGNLPFATRNVQQKLGMGGS
jgi:hypothetical protein